MRAGTNPNSRPNTNKGTGNTANGKPGANGGKREKIAAAQLTERLFVRSDTSCLLPFCGIMSVTCHVPDVRGTSFLLQVGVNPWLMPMSPVLLPHESQSSLSFLAASGSGTVSAGFLVFQRRGESADPGERIEVGQASVQ